MNKINKHISIDLDVFLELQDRGLNVSKLVNTQLRAYLDLPENKKQLKKEDLIKQKTLVQAEKVKINRKLERLEKAEEKEDKNTKWVK
jgi:hypothetical protein|tara:strand:+ start:11 stop:274 length:264 start_codon:yes stop_codon:yes gene_type:complete